MSNINDQELIVELQNQINELLENEELKDLETFPTEREIDTLIAVEQGQAFQISLDRSPLPSVRKSPLPLLSPDIQTKLNCSHHRPSILHCS